MTQKQANDALEQLNRGIQDSQRMVQEQNAELVREFFGGSVEGLKEQVSENQSSLESLKDKVPGGQEEFFQTIVEEMMDAYSIVEESLDNAMDTVSSIDVQERINEAFGEAEGAEEEESDEEEEAEEESGEEEEAEEEEEPGEDEEAGEEEEAEEAPGEGIKATDAARQKAEQLGVDLAQIEGSGSGGLVIVKDVVNAKGGS